MAPRTIGIVPRSLANGEIRTGAASRAGRSGRSAGPAAAAPGSRRSTISRQMQQRDGGDADADPDPVLRGPVQRDVERRRLGRDQPAVGVAVDQLRLAEVAEPSRLGLPAGGQALPEHQPERLAGRRAAHRRAGRRPGPRRSRSPAGRRSPSSSRCARCPGTGWSGRPRRRPPPRRGRAGRGRMPVPAAARGGQGVRAGRERHRRCRRAGRSSPSRATAAVVEPPT